MTGPTAYIDISAAVANWRMLARRAAPAQAAAVVKADAYGLGAEQIAPALLRAGCNRFYVAWPEEGAALRRFLGAGPEIAVFIGPDAGNLSTFLQHDLEPVISTPEQAAFWAREGGGRRASVHVDTGMNRLGLSQADWASAATALPAPHRLISHLACADDPLSDMNARQLEQFASASALWPGVPRSLSATAGVYLGPAYAMEEVRPGIGLYGGGPIPATGDAPRPVVRLTAPVLQIREAAAGDTAGYGATWSAPRPCTLATVGLGYADGFLRAATNRGHGVIRGARRPIVGRVSMDLIILDATGVGAHIGDEVEFLGPNAAIAEQAQAMQTNDYEILTRLGGRIHRIWTADE